MSPKLYTYGELISLLLDHDIEIWYGYAVGKYTINSVPGEAFTRLELLAKPESLKNFLNY